VRRSRNLRRRHRGCGRAAEREHRRHDLRREAPDPARVDGLPEPVIALAIEPKTRPTRRSWARTGEAAGRGPDVKVRPTRRRQVVISGMGELHLEIIVDRLKREFSVEPASAGRRCLQGDADQARVGRGRYVPADRRRASTGTRRSASSRAARARDSSSSTRLSEADPARVHQAHRRGDRETLTAGVLASYPVACPRHPVRRLVPRGRLVEMAFKIAARWRSRTRRGAPAPCCSSR